MAETTPSRVPGSPAVGTSAQSHPGDVGSLLVHRRMVAAIQNVSVDVMSLASDPRSRMQTLRDLLVADRVLYEQAHAIGVPDEWIDQAREAGQEGRRPSGTYPLPARRQVSRPMLLARLHHQVDRLSTLAAVGPVRRDRGPVVLATAAERLGEHLRLQWLRVAMVATAINLTEAEADGWWSTDTTHWRTRLDQIQQQPAPDQGRQWRELTAMASVREARCRVAAMRMVGIDLTASQPHQLPPAPDLLEASAEQAWHTAQFDTEPGARIGAAIAVTGIDDGLDIVLDDTHDLPPPALSRDRHAEPEL